jgi:hypothetical protein
LLLLIEDGAAQSSPISSGVTLARAARYRVCLPVAIALLIVVSGLHDFDFIVARSVHEPMFVVDPAGPVSGQLTLERFWFTDTAKRVALDLSDESSDPSGDFSVGGQPE